jgi:hypothetical protein
MEASGLGTLLFIESVEAEFVPAISFTAFTVRFAGALFEATVADATDP